MGAVFQQNKKFFSFVVRLYGTNLYLILEFLYSRSFFSAILWNEFIFSTPGHFCQCDYGTNLFWNFSPLPVIFFGIYCIISKHPRSDPYTAFALSCFRHPILLVILLRLLVCKRDVFIAFWKEVLNEREPDCCWRGGGRHRPKLNLLKLRTLIFRWKPVQISTHIQS